MSEVRDRMVVGAAELLAQAGLTETSFSAVIARTGAPRGSIYHHFPGGKDEMVSDALRHVGGLLIGALRRMEVDTPADVALGFAGMWRRMMAATAAPGCPVAAVTVEATAESAPAQEAANVFAAWRQELEALYTRAGAAEKDVSGLAVLTLAAVEGAIVLTRANGDLDTFDSVIAELVSAVARPGPTRRRATARRRGSARAPASER